MFSFMHGKHHKKNYSKFLAHDFVPLCVGYIYIYIIFLHFLEDLIKFHVK
jgi:uncharacterized membrane protein